MKNSKRSIYHPRYWIYWLILFVLWLISLLPYRVLLKLGTGLGWLIMKLAARARRTTRINLDLCFPHLSEQQREELVKRNFYSVGIGVLELLLSWWAKKERLQPLMHFNGLQYLKEALAKGQGVIIAAPHLTSLKIALRMFSTRYPVAVMYNRQKHRWFEHFNQRALNKYYAKAIPRENVRSMVKALKQNMIICYTPDVDPGRKNTVFAPFFGISTATVTAITRFTEMTGAQVLFASFYRREDGSGYELTVEPPLENFPTGHVVQDATLINQTIEKVICYKPEQYIWQYKRFKTRPAGERSFYD